MCNIKVILGQNIILSVLQFVLHIVRGTWMKIFSIQMYNDSLTSSQKYVYDWSSDGAMFNL